MKKLYTTLLLLVMSVCAFAQTDGGRLLVQEKSGSVQGYLIDRVDSVYFDMKDYGRVAADVEILSYAQGEESDTLMLTITRTEECWSYKLDVMQKALVDMLGTEDRIAAQVEYQSDLVFYEDFTSGQLTGLKFNDDSEYCVVTVGYDGWGIPCHVSRADFRTPAKPVTGNPSVECVIEDITTDGFTAVFTPNSDTSAYYYVVFAKGEAQAQFDMFAPMFGFTNMGQMIEMWGIKMTTADEYSYTGLIPGTDYELYIQPLDVNGVYGPMVIVDVRTADLGGDGPAEIAIEIGEVVVDEYGLRQYVRFTPNENVSVYHTVIIEKKAFLEDEYWGGKEENIVAYLQQEIPGDPWWDLFKEDYSPWGLDPNTEYLACAMGKNAKGEWGALAKVEFKTPDADIPAPETTAKKVAKRLAKPVTIDKGVSPVGKIFNRLPAQLQKMQLIQK